MKTRKVKFPSFQLNNGKTYQEAQHTPTPSDIAMENLAVLDELTRQGYSESVVDRIENTLNSHEELITALECMVNGYEPYSGCNIERAKQVLKKAKGK